MKQLRTTALGAALLAATAILLSSAAAAGKRSFIAAQSGHSSERIEAFEIKRDAKSSRRVAFSLSPRKFPDLAKGDRLEVSGEVTLTTTCVDGSSRCIGRPYSYSPRLGARIFVARGKNDTRGRSVKPIGRRVSLKCRQDRPNRNHHCPLVISSAVKRIKKVTSLPCKPSRCRLNLVVDAHHRRAVDGNVVVVGADRPGGDVDQNKGRLNALLTRAGSRPRIESRRTRKRVTSAMPMGSSGSGGHRVIYSVKLPRLRRGDAILARARQLTEIGHLPYSAFIGSELIVATKRSRPRSTGLARRAIANRGNLGAANGFNCTQGSSAFRTPCLTRKVALGLVKRDVVNRRGRSVPLYVNLISRSFPKRARTGSGDAAIVAGGSLEARRLVR
jgi:hypothetical protein